jgi:hypothetical protein
MAVITFLWDSAAQIHLSKGEDPFVLIVLLRLGYWFPVLSWTTGGHGLDH